MMAPSILLLLPALFFSLLLLMVPSTHCIVDPTSTTLAISQATSTVCGIMAGSQRHTIQCTRFQNSANSTAFFPIDPTISFDSITGGHNFICSLRSGDSSFFCWDGIGRRIKRIYPGPTALSQLSAGARHVAAIDADRMRIRWWRYGCNRHTRRCRHFPKSVSGMYHSLTSGDVFTCALNGTNSVHCWGPRAKPIQRRFSGVYMRSLTAGGGRMCGLNETGHLICTGNQSNSQFGEAFEFTSIAIGSSQTCAIMRKNGMVVCWGRRGSYFPAGSTSFDLLVAGGDLTCGLTTDSFNVACWGLNGRNSSAVILTLPKILPGACVPDASFCSCGVYPDSGDLCGGSGVICKKSGTGATGSCQFSPPVIEQVTDNKWKKRRKLWLAYAICGAGFGTFCIGVLLGQWLDHRRKEKNTADQNEYNFLANVPPPVFPQMENVQVFTFKELKTATNRFNKRLGSGGFGRVFEGRLSNNRMVAVKRFKAHSIMDSEAVFRVELISLSEARHENVVELIGYCTEKNQRLLVFEFMSRGDLYRHIHPRNSQQRSLLFSSWKMRVKVLLDVARGIEYLHYGAHRRMIHRDIKSQNILIGENWVAKISDFGLALFGPEEGTTHVDVDEATGTPGYNDPDCNANLRVTQRSDVYGFGVVMLEVITGRLALDETTHLAELAAPMCKEGRLLEVLDKRLDVPQGEAWTAVYRVAFLAQQCVRETNQRPNMNIVVGWLAAELARFDRAWD